MQIKVILNIRTVSHLDSLWNRGTGELGNGIDFDDFTSPFTFVFTEKTYQTLETMFHRLSEDFEFRQKHFAARRIFNSLLGV